MDKFMHSSSYDDPSFTPSAPNPSNQGVDQQLKIRNDWQEISRETDAAFVVPASYVVRIEGGSS